MSNALGFVTVQPKKTFDVNMSKPIKNFLKSSSNDKEDFSSAIDAFNTMRSEVLLRPTFKDDPSKITKYVERTSFRTENFLFSLLDITTKFTLSNRNFRSAKIKSEFSSNGKTRFRTAARRCFPAKTKFPRRGKFSSRKLRFFGTSLMLSANKRPPKTSRMTNK